MIIAAASVAALFRIAGILPPLCNVDGRAAPAGILPTVHKLFDQKQMYQIQRHFPIFSTDIS